MKAIVLNSGMFAALVAAGHCGQVDGHVDVVQSRAGHGPAARAVQEAGCHGHEDPATPCGRRRSKATAAVRTTYKISLEGRLVGGVVMFKGTVDLGAQDGGVLDWVGRGTTGEFIGFYTSAYRRGISI